MEFFFAAEPRLGGVGKFQGHGHGWELPDGGHRRGLVGAGHVGGLEPFEDFRVNLEVAGAGDGRQFVGGGGADGGSGFLRGEGAQADAVGQVGFQALEAAFFEPLGCEQQVHADGPANAADLDEQVDEFGFGRQEFAELVDDDEEHRQGVGDLALVA